VATADVLAQEGIGVEVIDLCSISPLDTATVLASVAKTRRAVIAHDSVEAFGIGAELSSRIHESLFNELTAPVHRVGAEYAPVPYSGALEQHYVVGQDRIVNAIRSALK
jgi:acetoin:2,6-dichlorophenolindophenol oxidoreductase subunit beta